MREAVSPSQIESKLEKLADQLQGTNQMRACLFNLILYATSSERDWYMKHVAEKVIEKFPSRILLITTDRKSGPLRSFVSFMSGGAGNKEIACDLIELEIPEEEKEQTTFLILPHLIPDLPTYIVHTEDLLNAPLLPDPLESIATRVIYDSKNTQNLSLFAKTLLDSYRHKATQIADLNWARTEGWRQLFGNLFKSDEELAKLIEARQMTLTYNASSVQDKACQTEIQSIFFQAWIALQLGWKLQKVSRKERTFLFFYENGDQTTEVILTPGYSNKVSTGRLLSFEFASYQNHHFSMKRSKGSPHQVIIEQSSPHLCMLPTTFALDRGFSDQSLVREICHEGVSTQYLKVLTLLSKVEQTSLHYE